MATAMSLYISNLLPLGMQRTANNLVTRPIVQLRPSPLSFIHGKRQCYFHQYSRRSSYRLTVFAATEGSTKSSKSDENIPSWAKPDSDEPPPWARDDGIRSSSQPTVEIPFFVYLLASAITAIAAIGSMFEYVNQKPVFGVINADSVFYAPLLGFFAFTGIPTSAFLWFKSVQAANKEAEEQDRRDGYR